MTEKGEGRKKSGSVCAWSIMDMYSVHGWIHAGLSLSGSAGSRQTPSVVNQFRPSTKRTRAVCATRGSIANDHIHIPTPPRCGWRRMVGASKCRMQARVMDQWAPVGRGMWRRLARSCQATPFPISGARASPFWRIR